MKTMASKFNWRAAAYSAALLLLGGSGPLAQAQRSPVGTWDLVIGGPQRGVAQITFSNNMTLGGIELMNFIPHKTSADTNPRGPFFSGGRLPFSENTDSTPVTNFYGRASITGSWTYDAVGRTIGVFTESGGVDGLTNGVSFRAVVRPGIRINLEAVRHGRRIHYRGVPLNPLTDYSGDFYGIGRKDGKELTELFSLTPAAEMNSYNVVGVGADYSFFGWTMVSAKSQMGFVTLSSETTNGILRSVSGPFRLSRGTGSLRGVNSDGHGGDVSTSLRITKQ